MQDRSRKTIFDSFAKEYHAARPGYPGELVDAICSRLPVRARVLEMGSGTGKLTRPFAERGCSLTCVELGANLAAVARRELAGAGDVTIVATPFEDFEPDGHFDAIVSGQAWHWLDPATSYVRAAGMLAPGGVFGALWNMYPRKETEFVSGLYDLYAAHVPELATPYHRRTIDQRVAERTAEVEGSGAFQCLEVLRADWDWRLDARQYIDLLETYSNHRAVPEERRLPFYQSVKTLIDEFGGTITRHYTCALYLGT